MLVCIFSHPSNKHKAGRKDTNIMVNLPTQLYNCVWEEYCKCNDVMWECLSLPMEMFVYRMANTEALSVKQLGRKRLQFVFAKLLHSFSST